ncbi:hypothetical protein [Krasilnikovia sp. MM14-A1259]|uniref:hypothetical protein n=1 Tax=Krasilnikovia sp. MM14-A1259 TaxID=3373539 RepID=UPI00399CAFF9
MLVHGEPECNDMVFIAATAVVMLILRSFGDLAANKPNHQTTETPAPLTDGTGRIVFPGFPADLLFNLRLHSIGAQFGPVGHDRPGLRPDGRAAPGRVAHPAGRHGRTSDGQRLSIACHC